MSRKHYLVPGAKDVARILVENGFENKASGIFTQSMLKVVQTQDHLILINRSRKERKKVSGVFLVKDYLMKFIKSGVLDNPERLED